MVFVVRILFLFDMCIDFFVGDTQELLFLVGLVPKVGLELGAALVQCNRMSEGTYDVVRSGKWEAARDQTNRVDSIPNEMREADMKQKRIKARWDVPYTEEFYVDVDREGLFE